MTRLFTAALSLILLWTPAAATEQIGRSVEGRMIELVRVGDPQAATRVLVVGCIHGNECAGIAVVRRLERASAPPGVELVLVPTFNPDGRAAGTRQNARGVDLNRNFPWGWRRQGRPGSTYYSGPRPLSEPETRAATRLVEHIRPQITIWYHQHLSIVVRTGGDVGIQRHYARLVGLPLRRLPPFSGAATRWQNNHFPGTTSFVVELPAGPPTARAAARHADAVLAISR